jgi:large subunit ribosomal protein L23
MSIIKKPILTEKMMNETEQFNRYGFVVDKRANKIEIKKAIEDLFGVDVLAVRTMNYPPERKTRYTKSGVVSGKTNAYKKAIVQIGEGQSIDFYNNI